MAPSDLIPHVPFITLPVYRAAMQHMQNGIVANGLTTLQQEWGGTHDALLGMFLWIYDIPTYSLNK